MKRLLLTLCLALISSPVDASFEYRDLTVEEKTALRTAASEAAGTGVWQILGRVIRVEAGDTSMVNVVFDPADVSGYCLATSAIYAAESPDRVLLDWNPIEGNPIKYLFWYQACEAADPQSPVVLEQYVDTIILEKLRVHREQIVGDAGRYLSPGREYDVPASDHRLNSIGIRFDADVGAVYELSYSGTNCRGLSVDVLLSGDEIRVLRSAEWVC